MVFVVCCVRDLVSEQFQSLVVEENENSAIRNFEASVLLARERQNGLLYTHPGDFALFLVGYFNSKSGDLDAVPPKLLRKADEVG